MEETILMEWLRTRVMDLVYSIDNNKIMLAHTLSIEIREEIEKMLKEKIREYKNGKQLSSKEK